MSSSLFLQQSCRSTEPYTKHIEKMQKQWAFLSEPTNNTELNCWLPHSWKQYWSRAPAGPWGSSCAYPSGGGGGYLLPAFSALRGWGGGGSAPCDYSPASFYCTVQSKCFNGLLFISQFFPCAACPPGTWGPRCENSCPCLHSASCDPVSGECTCGPGWWGNRCHLKCDAFRCLEKKFRPVFGTFLFFYFVVLKIVNIGRKRANLFFVLILFIFNLTRIDNVELHIM